MECAICLLEVASEQRAWPNRFIVFYSFFFIHIVFQLRWPHLPSAVFANMVQGPECHHGAD
jgi:hypothetical protein